MIDRVAGWICEEKFPPVHMWPYKTTLQKDLVMVVISVLNGFDQAKLDRER